MSGQGATALSQSIARILAETIIKAHQVTTPHKAEHTRNAVDGWMDEAEVKLAPLLQQMFSDVDGLDGTHDGLQALIDATTGPQNQTDFILQIIASIGWAISGTAILGAIQAQEMANQLWQQKLSKPLSPADLADMVERNIVGEDWAANEAAKSGLGPENFKLLVKDTGEPYGIDQALSLLRRGLISESRFEELLFYSRVRNEFLPDVLQLAHDTMSGADAIEAVLKGIISPGEGQTLFEMAGGVGSQFQPLLDAAGNPIGVQEANMLFNHGLISDAQLTQVILHSRINPIFEPMAKLLRFHYMPAFQISQMLTTGSATAGEAARWLTEEGYPADQVAAFVAHGTHTKAVTAKTLTEAQITEAYELGIYSRPQADSMLQSLGYPAAQVDFILTLFEDKRILGITKGALALVKKSFLAGRTDETEARTYLAELGIDQAAIGAYVVAWDVEKQAEFKTLTVAQIGDAVKGGYMTPGEADARWLAMGYDDADRGVLAKKYPPPTAPATG